MESTYRVRIPKTLAETFMRQRTSLARKIAAGMKGPSRNDWGPLIEVTEDEAAQLEERANEMRQREGAPPREISAAIKMIDTLKKVRNPVNHGDNQNNNEPLPDGETGGYDIAQPSEDAAKLLAAAMGQQAVPRSLSDAVRKVTPPAPAPVVPSANVSMIERQLIRIETVMDVIGETLPGAKRVLEDALRELRSLYAV